MKKKNLLITALVGSVALGIYYMGKNTILKQLQQKGLITVNENGKFVLTPKGNKNIMEVIDENGNVSYMKTTATGNAFDYNNPEFHSADNYWKQADITIDNGEVKPSILKSAITGIKSIFSFGGTI